MKIINPFLISLKPKTTQKIKIKFLPIDKVIVILSLLVAVYQYL